MTVQWAKRMAAAAGVAVVAGTLPILVASPASATQSACTSYVANHGYFAGPKVKAACDYAALDTGLFKMANPACLLQLAKVGVKSEVSDPACKRA
ncbi:hypothetical protein GCM10018980_46910 [Streptomyces capoamus]|uniref:Secreted protein n=1 Tax=Streptomyces capoamus TaxID=68183 RepID=A0A919EYL1_9ACTN|nr:hypothetical protein [Streptomyces capoamus]GGW18292.1 hypothetical protein GCM10010501_44480 [Streptomyces libani subsp. rufus]GHG59261.1 hypothetical protein GCM10018980_46910 [Streptomyces capoamus]